MDRRRFIQQSVAGAAGIGLAASAGNASVAKSANARLRIGIVGCGSRGNFLMEQLVLHGARENVEIAALCDVWKLNLERTRANLARRQSTAPRLFARYGEMFDMPDLDAIVIASPDFSHTPILLDATRRKKDVFVEKPMSTVLSQANEAVDLVKATGNIVQVGNQRRSDPRHREGARLIQSGILGTVSEVEAAWHDSSPRWARDYSDVRREDVDWEQFLMYLPREPFRADRFRRWHFFRDFTAGSPALLGAHLIDVGVWFMDDLLPVSAVAHGGVYVWKGGREHADTLDAIIEYPKGFLINYSTRLGNASPVPEVVFYGTKGTFDTKSWTARGEGGGRDAIASPIVVPAPQPVASTVPQGGSNALAASMNDPRVTGDDHVLNWLQCVRSRATPNATVDVGYAHSVASIMCLDAWVTGRRQLYDRATRTTRSA